MKNAAALPWICYALTNLNITNDQEISYSVTQKFKDGKVLSFKPMTRIQISIILQHILVLTFSFQLAWIANQKFSS